MSLSRKQRKARTKTVRLSRIRARLIEGDPPSIIKKPDSAIVKLYAEFGLDAWKFYKGIDIIPEEYKGQGIMDRVQYARLYYYRQTGRVPRTDEDALDMYEEKQRIVNRMKEIKE